MSVIVCVGGEGGPQGKLKEEKEKTGRRVGQREGATSEMFAAIQKPREIGSLFH